MPHQPISQSAQGKQASIMILVIVIMIVSSALGLLVMSYVNNMLAISSDYHAFNKAYYLAKAGIEMNLTKVAHREVGFQDTLGEGLVATFDCAVGTKGNISDQCQLSGDIIARGTLLTDDFTATDCTPETAYVLSGGDAMGFPLFYDNYTTTELFAQPIELTSLFYPSIDIVSPPGASTQIGAAVVKLLRNAETKKREPPKLGSSLVGTYQTPVNNVVSQVVGAEEGKDAGTAGPSKVFFLVVFNPNQDISSSVSFCLQSDQAIPLTHVGVKSIASYRGITIGLESSQTIDLPGFIFSTFINRE